MRVTQMNPNRTNMIPGQRISVYATADGVEIMVDRFCVTSMFGAVNYCKKHPTGKYGKRYSSALNMAIGMENTNN